MSEDHLKFYMQHRLLRVLLIPALCLVMPAAFAQSITGVTVSPNPVCTGAPLTVSFNRTSMPTSSTETVELSNASGNFPGTVLGTFTGATGTALVSAPLTGIAAGSAYVVRVSSTFPGVTTVTSSAFTVSPAITAPVFTIGGATSARCQGAATVSYIATSNSPSIAYTMVVTPPDPGVTLNNANGNVTYPAGFVGTVAVTATATGCGGPLSTTHTATVNANVETPTFSIGATSSRCQGAGNVNYGASATNTTGITYSLVQSSPTPVLSISASGVINYPAAYSGTVTITASAAGCNGPVTATHTATVTPAAGTPSFGALGATSTRCQGNLSQTYTATSSNSTGISYSISPAAAATSFNGATGAVTFASAFSGTVTITATSTGCQGTVSANHVITVTPALISLSFNDGPTSTICVGSGPLTYAVTALNNLGLNFSVTTAPTTGGATVNPLTGLVTFNPTFVGTVTLSLAGTGCNGILNASHTITVRGNVTTPAFAAPTSTRCQGATTESYAVSVSNQTSLSYSMTTAPAPGSVGTPVLNTTNGNVDYPAGFFGSVTVTATALGCTGPKTASHTATTNGTLVAPSFSIGSISSRCQGAQTLPYTATATNNLGLTYALQLSTPDAGTTINASTGAVTYSANFAGTATIEVTATGCGGPLVASHVVTVTGRPVFTPAQPTTRCQSFGIVTYGATSVNGTVNNYSITPVDPNLVINATTGQVSYGPSITGPVVITATANGPGCPSISNTFNVTVTPVVGPATFTTGATSTRCQGVGSETYTATAPNQTTVTYGLNATAIAGGVTINSGNGTVSYPATFSGTAIVTASVGGCGGSISTATRTVTVTPTVGIPQFTAGPTSSRCQGVGTVGYPANATTTTGITYAITNSPGPGVSINTGTGDVTYTAGFSGTVVITASAAGCNGPLTASHTVTITQTVATPSFTSGAVSSRCQGAGTVQYAATTSTPNTGIVYSLGLVPADPNTTINPTNGIVTYASSYAGIATITATASGCNGPSISTHVATVVGNPVFTAGSSSVRCQGVGSVIYNATALHSTGIIYSLALSVPDPNTTINPANGEVSFSADFSGTATVTAIGCNPGLNINHVVTVNATPHIYTLSDSICSGTAPSAPLLSTVSGSTFTWSLITPMPSRLSSVGSLTGSGATIINPVITNSSDLIDDSARYNVVTTYTANGQSCSGNDVFTLKVRHRPTVTTPGAFAICSGLNTNIILSASDTNSTFNWSSPVNRAVTINGNLNNGTTCNLCNTISQVLRDTGINTGIVVYTANATANGCTGPNKNITVTVNPNPIITFPRPNTNFSVCSERPLSIPILDTPGVGTTSFYWSFIPQAGINVTPAPFGNTIRDSVVNLSGSLTPTPVTYTVFDTSFLGCAATPVQFTVTVNPKPIFNNVTKSICSQDSANVQLTASTGTGSTFTWTVLSTTGGITGAGPGGGIVIGQPLTNPTFTTQGSVLYNVIPFSPAPAACQGNPGTVLINVNPLPKMTSDTSRTICSDAQLSYNVVSSTGPSTNYTYTRTGSTNSIPTVLPTVSESVNQPIVDLISSAFSLVPHRADYLINLTSAAGCKFDNQRLGVTVNPTPDSPGISIAPPVNLCRNTIGINLGARRQPAVVERFTWSSNQTINQLVDSTRFALATFNTQGTATATVVSRVVGFTCTSVASTRQFNVSAGTGSNNPNVVMFQNNLVCQGLNITKYQWGFDRRVNLDSVIIEGATYQNLFTGAGSGFDPNANFYWVMTTFTDGCTRKSYFNQPSLSTPGIATSNKSELKLYPNPATDEVTVELSDAGAQSYSIEVYDVSGRRLHSQEASGLKSRVNVSSFVPGYYSVICTHDGVQIGSARFIKK